MLEGIILAGGFGTRLREVVQDLPKPMAPVAGRPFLEILLASLAAKGFHRIVLSLGYMADSVVSHFGNKFDDMEIIYEIEDKPLGTGGAIRSALACCISDHVFVFNGDTFIDLEIEEIELHWQNSHVPIIVSCEVPDTSRYGRLQTSNGRVSGFSEKGISGKGLINAGCYILPTNIMDKFTPGQTFSLETDFLAQAVNEQQFNLYLTHGIFIDIGLPEDYARAQTLLQNMCR